MKLKVCRTRIMPMCQAHTERSHNFFISFFFLLPGHIILPSSLFGEVGEFTRCRAVLLHKCLAPRRTGGRPCD